MDQDNTNSADFFSGLFNFVAGEREGKLNRVRFPTRGHIPSRLSIHVSVSPKGMHPDSELATAPYDRTAPINDRYCNDIIVLLFCVTM